MTVKLQIGSRVTRKSVASVRVRSRKTEVASKLVGYQIIRKRSEPNFLFSHMTCKKCKYEFCWVCMGMFHLSIWYFIDLYSSYNKGPWSEHGTSWYNCNRYDESSGVEARDAQARSRASLERYLHVCSHIVFYLCFFNHSFLFSSTIF